MYRPELVKELSRGGVVLRHTARFTSLGRYHVDGECGRFYTTFYGNNPDGSIFTVQDAGGEFDDYGEAETFVDELNDDHTAFVTWYQTLTRADRAYLAQRAAKTP